LFLERFTRDSYFVGAKVRIFAVFLAICKQILYHV